MSGSFDVLLLGTMHFNNPALEVGNIDVDDVLAPKRQAEIEEIADGLARFAPTKVAVEWPIDRAADVAEAFQRYCDDERPLGRGEQSQLGFRVARRVGATVHAIDQPDEFWDPEVVEDFTTRHPELESYVERFWSTGEASAELDTKFLAEHTLGEALRRENTDAYRHNDLASYYEHLIPLGVGADDEYPGARAHFRTAPRRTRRSDARLPLKEMFGPCSKWVGPAMLVGIAGNCFRARSRCATWR
jgi:hypothetical protein